MFRCIKPHEFSIGSSANRSNISDLFQIRIISGSHIGRLSSLFDILADGLEITHSIALSVSDFVPTSCKVDVFSDTFLNKVRGYIVQVIADY